MKSWSYNTFALLSWKFALNALVYIMYMHENIATVLESYKQKLAYEKYEIISLSTTAFCCIFSLSIRF